MRNIIFITHHLGGIGGVQTFVDTLATKFTQDGYAVSVIGCSTPKKSTKVDGNTCYQVIPLYEEDIYTTRIDKLFFDSFVTRKSAKKIQKIIDAKKEPIVIITNPLVYVFVKDVDFTNAAMVIGQIHTSADFILHKRGMYQAYKYFIKKYYADLSQVLLLSREDAQEIAAYFHFSHVSSIPNPINLQVSIDLSKIKKKKKIVILGRLDKNKRVDHAIKAFALFSQKNEDWFLDIYGEGQTKRQLQILSETLGIADKINFKGVTTNLAEVFLDAQMLLLTSEKEGQPMALMEAMVYGVPVFAYNCSPGVAELVADEGRLIENGNYKALSHQMCRVVELNELKDLSQSALEQIKKYQLEYLVAHWYELFRKLERK